MRLTPTPAAASSGLGGRPVKAESAHARASCQGGERGVLGRQAVALGGRKPGRGRRPRPGDELSSFPPGHCAARHHQARHASSPPAGSRRGGDARDAQQGVDHGRFSQAADCLGDHDSGRAAPGLNAVEHGPVSSRQPAVISGSQGYYRQCRERDRRTRDPPPGRHRHVVPASRAASRVRRDNAVSRKGTA